MVLKTKTPTMGDNKLDISWVSPVDEEEAERRAVHECYLEALPPRRSSTRRRDAPPMNATLRPSPTPSRSWTMPAGTRKGRQWPPKYPFLWQNIDLPPVVSVTINPLRGYEVHIPHEFRDRFFVFYD
jgi:hypothetical protein